MKYNDHILMEEAYDKILVNELNWKGAAAGLALGASALGGAGNAQAKQIYPQDNDGAGIESRENPELDAEESLKSIQYQFSIGKSLGEILKETPNILNSIKERIEKGDIDLAKRLVWAIKISNENRKEKNKPEEELPKFLKPYDIKLPVERI